MARYSIQDDASALVVELTEVEGDQQKELLEAFAECQSGQCSCPTVQYEKVATMDVRPTAQQITLRLEAKPGEQFDSAEIATCLDHTIDKVARRS